MQRFSQHLLLLALCSGPHVLAGTGTGGSGCWSQWCPGQSAIEGVVQLSVRWIRHSTHKARGCCCCSCCSCSCAASLSLGQQGVNISAGKLASFVHACLRSLATITAPMIAVLQPPQFSAAFLCQSATAQHGAPSSCHCSPLRCSQTL